MENIGRLFPVTDREVNDGFGVGRAAGAEASSAGGGVSQGGGSVTRWQGHPAWTHSELFSVQAFITPQDSPADLRNCSED